jgi:hypothetical protein
MFLLIWSTVALVFFANDSNTLVKFNYKRGLLTGTLGMNQSFITKYISMQPKYFICPVAFFLFAVLTPACLYAQEQKVSKTKFIIGLSAPEIFHAGVTYRIANASLIGLNAGLGPTMGGVWPSISLEHRLYFGKNSEVNGQKIWFFRQGTTFFPVATESEDPAKTSSQSFTLNLTVGKDLPSKNHKSGATIDAGVFYLPGSEQSSVILVRSMNLWPALRFEFYF